MARVIITKTDTGRAVALTGRKAERTIEALDAARPNAFARLLDRLFAPRRNVPDPAPADYVIEVTEPGPRRRYDLVGTAVLRPHDGTLPRGFPFGANIAAWHAAGIGTGAVS